MGRLFDLDNPVMVFLTKLADLIILNFLTMICCIPIITVGASYTALHYVALKIVRNEECYIVKSYFKSFKQNFKQATVLWLIELAVIAVFVIDFLIFKGAGQSFPDWMRIMLLGVGVLAIFATMHVFPLLAKFDNTVGKTLKNSLMIGILILPKTVLMMVVWVIPIVIAIYLPQIMPVVIMLGISGPAVICALLYNKAFKRFEPEEEALVSDEEWTMAVEGEEEASEMIEEPEQKRASDTEDFDDEMVSEESADRKKEETQVEE